MSLTRQNARDLNLLIQFLAASEPLPDSADLVILLGNAIPSSADLAAQTATELRALLMISGGIGHSTSYLAEALGNSRPGQVSEAELLLERLRSLGYADEVILETKSTNCGANAVESKEVLRDGGLAPETIVLIQDPTMMRRSRASFEKVFGSTSPAIGPPSPTFFNLPAIIPHLEEGEWNPELPWSYERFLGLVLGEFPRFREYGPDGKGFIVRVDIPGEVEQAFERMKERHRDSLRKIEP